MDLRVFIEFIRGVPLITLLFVANVVLAYFFPPGSNIRPDLRVIIMITMFSAAYIAEVIRVAWPPCHGPVRGGGQPWA